MLPDIFFNMSKDLTLRLPTCWQELTPSDVRHAIAAITYGSNYAESVYLMLTGINGITLVGESGRDYVFEKNRRKLLADKNRFVWALLRLDFLSDTPTVPVAPDGICGLKVRDAALRKLTFGQWLEVDNLIQGYIATENRELMERAANILLNVGRPFRKSIRRMTKTDITALLLWTSSIKGYLARKYPNLFPAQDEPQDSALSLAGQDQSKTVDAMIRALSEGDITKEEAILGSNMYRAFSELNAKAKEAQEYNRKYKNNGSK